MTRFHSICAVLASSLLLGAVPALAQLPTNATLNGSYYVRYLGVVGTPCDCAMSFNGTLNFDGNGKFTLSGSGITNNGSDKPVTAATSGTYTVLNGGLFFMSNPFNTSSTTTLYGGFGNGALVASSTESVYLDIMVAMPAATSASAATLSGDYQIADLEFANGSLGAARNALFKATANGAGSFGNVTIKGTSMALRSAPTVQTSSGATYTMTANGTGTLNLPAPNGVSTANQLMTGNKTLYVSQDGSWFIGGNPSGYDLFIGVKAMSGSNNVQPLKGVYYDAWLLNSSDPNVGVLAASGSANEVGDANGSEFAHDRINFDGSGGGYDSTYGDNFSFNSDGTYADSSLAFAAGANGNFLIGTGSSSDYYMFFYVKLQNMSNGSAPFLNPALTANAASYTPLTGQVSPGEFLFLGGTGLASQLTVASTATLPKSLAGVSVTVQSGSGTPVQAPIYYVSPTAISIVLPYSIPVDGTVITIQVNNNGALSNTVQAYTGYSQPGIFTQTASGLGLGAIQHAADFSLVTSANPAKVGETVLVYLTGMGTVTPAVEAGASVPLSPQSKVDNPFGVAIDGVNANVLFGGLVATTPAGLYVLAVTIPSGVTAGSVVSCEVFTGDPNAFLVADNFQAGIPIAK